MKSVSEAQWQRWKALAAPIAGVIVAPADDPPINGQLTASGKGGVIEEYLDMQGQPVARRVCACGSIECWLRSDQLSQIRDHA